METHELAQYRALLLDCLEQVNNQEHYEMVIRDLGELNARVVAVGVRA